MLAFFDAYEQLLNLLLSICEAMARQVMLAHGFEPNFHLRRPRNS